MRFFLKKFVYILLTLAIANISVQSLYAASDSCHEMDMAMEANINMTAHEEMPDNDKHCISQKMDDPCSCENCSCDMCITLQANIPTLPKAFTLDQLISDTPVDVIHQYTYYFHNPLLRPPIA
jgi:hypothetical protein